MKTSELIVWTKTQQELKNFVYRKVRDKALAEDIVQDVFLKVHAKLEQLKDTDSVNHKFFKIYIPNNFLAFSCNSLRSICLVSLSFLMAAIVCAP